MRRLRSGPASCAVAPTELLDLGRVRLDAADHLVAGEPLGDPPGEKLANLVRALDPHEQSVAVLDLTTLEDLPCGGADGRVAGRGRSAIGLAGRQVDSTERLPEQAPLEAVAATLAALAGAEHGRLGALRPVDPYRLHADAAANLLGLEAGVRTLDHSRRQELHRHLERTALRRLVGPVVEVREAADLDEVLAVLLDRRQVVAPERLDPAEQAIHARTGAGLAEARARREPDHGVEAGGRDVDPAGPRRLEARPDRLAVDR